VAAALLLAGSGRVQVPDVGLQSEGQAIASIRRSGLVPVVGAPVASATVARGLVARQSPAGGTAVGKGTKVQIQVSEGPATTEVPSVEGLTVAKARQRLTAAGFTVASRAEPSTSVAPGKVLGSEPSAGLEARRGTRVTLLVSSGPAAVRVPDVVGLSRSAAEAALENAGLAVGAVSERASNAQPPGNVLQQTPAANASVHAGEKVSLVLAQASNTVTVPVVVGKNEALAAASLGAAGLTPHTVSAPTTEATKVGIVLTQRPSAGKRERKGATVTIGVGTLVQPTTTPTAPTTTPTTTTPGG
jgi:serine/threonine-protein kinase